MSTTWINRGHYYVPHVRPVEVDCAFIVNNADTAGLGITKGSLRGQGVANVFMHTTQTPGTGSNGQLNPNPAVGIVAVQLTDNFYKLYMADMLSRGPLSGSNLAVDSTALTIGQIYVITALGTTTSADWLALGVPAGVTPAINVAFIAKVTGTGSGSGTVQLQTVSGIYKMESIGSESLSLAPIPVGGSPNVGGWLYFSLLGPTSTTSTVLIPTAPAALSTFHLSFYMSQSSVVVAGE